MAGVIPPIFASSIILFPATIGGWFGTPRACSLAARSVDHASPGQPLYVMLYAAAIIIFFCFFYTALVFNPKETADNLKKHPARFIPGIRPGDADGRYIDNVMTRLTAAGAHLHHGGVPAAGVPDPEASTCRSISAAPHC